MFLLILLINILRLSISISTKGAFCEEIDEYRKRSFPLRVPHRHLPWVFDAIYDQSITYDFPDNEYQERNHFKGLVEVISIAQEGCAFNHTKWHETVNLFPDFADQLAYGKKSNILVNSDSFSFSEMKDMIYTDVGLLGEQMECIYYNSNQEEVFRSLSLVIKGVQLFVPVSTIQIRCPSPSRERYPWTMMRLKRNMTAILDYQKNQQSKMKIKHNNYKLEYSIDSDSETEMFPVCIVQPVPKYAIKNFTICTASNRGRRDHLVEWIEYHKLLGVDHFVMYDTNMKKGPRLTDLLSDYVNERTVTVISWPYENCARNMASGHLTFWFPNYPDTQNVETFRPPRAVSQTAALSSCYARYRSKSKYIGHIDEDEFYAFSRNRNNTDWASTKSITGMADALFLKNPEKAAIRFHPLCFYQCHAPIKTHAILPRVESWWQGKLENIYESKMIMRTDAVIQFFVHYVLDVENKNEWLPDPDSYILPTPKHAVLFHYKEQGTIWGNRIPLVIDANNNVRSHNCDTKKLQELEFVDTTVKGLNKGKVLHHIPKYMTDLLEMKFNQRMEKKQLHS